MPLFVLSASVFHTAQNRTYYRELAMFPPNGSDYALPRRELGKKYVKAEFPCQCDFLSVVC
jgi:hypothetical protein